MKPAQLIKLLYVQVLIGLALGITVGHYWPEFGAALKPLGDGFVKLVKMMIAPIVFCTIVSGITSLNDSREIGKTLLKSMGLFYALTILALLTGLGAVSLMQPGTGMHIDPAHLDAAVAAKYSSQVPPRGFTEFVLHIIPGSFFGAFAEGEVLPVLLLSVLCGFGLTRIGAAGRAVLDGIDGLAHMLFAAFGFIMRLAPLGAFGAMAFTVGRYGIKSIGSLGLLIGTFYVACAFFVVVVLGLLARLHGFKLWQLLRYIREELLVVLGTSSSEPVLPRLLMKLERLGCKKGVVGLVLPTGYSFNLDGTAIYLTLASMFIAHACDIH
jgi:Na+/H+-dicarboxylate symporter